MSESPRQFREKKWEKVEVSAPKFEPELRQTFFRWVGQIRTRNLPFKRGLMSFGGRTVQQIAEWIESKAIKFENCVHLETFELRFANEQSIRRKTTFQGLILRRSEPSSELDNGQAFRARLLFWPDVAPTSAIRNSFLNLSDFKC